MPSDPVLPTAENDVPDRPNRRAHPKNTKRWCRGIIGHEHVTRIVVPANAVRQECDVRDDSWAETYSWEIGCRHVEQCMDCGKHVRPFLDKGECPTRVIPPGVTDGEARA